MPRTKTAGERAETWIGVVLGFFALINVPTLGAALEVTPIAALIPASVDTSDLSPQSNRNDKFAAVWDFLLFVGTPITSIALSFLIRWGRNAVSRRYVTAVVSGRRAVASWWPSVPWTVAEWSVLLGGLTFVSMFVAAVPADPKAAVPTEDLLSPDALLFSLGCVIGAISFSAWRHQHRRRTVPLFRAGILVRRPAQRVVGDDSSYPAGGRPRVLRLGITFRNGMKTALLLFVIQGVFLALGWMQLVADGNVSRSSTFAQEGIRMMIMSPALISSVVLTILLFNPFTFWTVLGCLRHPITILSLSLLALGGLTNLVFSGLAGNLIAFLGILIASATMLQVMDRGVQPWVGLFALVAGWLVGLSIAQDGSPTPITSPVGVFSWIGLVLGTGYTIWELRKHWRDYFPPWEVHPAHVQEE